MILKQIRENSLRWKLHTNGTSPTKFSIILNLFPGHTAFYVASKKQSKQFLLRQNQKSKIPNSIQTIFALVKKLSSTSQFRTRMSFNVPLKLFNFIVGRTMFEKVTPRMYCVQIQHPSLGCCKGFCNVLFGVLYKGVL